MQQALKEGFLTFLSPTGIRSSSLPQEFFLLLTDSLESPATFLLSHFIAKSLKEGRKSILIGSSYPFDHYAAILKKSSVQLASARERGTFNFIGATPSSPDLFQTLSISLQAALENSQQPLIVLDDVSSFLWSGKPLNDIVRFIVGIRKAVSACGGALVVLQHGDELGSSESEDYALFRRLLQRCDLWLEVTNLSSQTHGELSIHRGPALVNDYGVIDRSGASALQYKLEDAGPVFSVKGLGQGFL